MAIRQLFLFLALTFILNSHSSLLSSLNDATFDPSPSGHSDVERCLKAAEKFLLNITNFSVLIRGLNCFSHLKKLLDNNDTHELSYCFSRSGKGLFDKGLEKGCSENTTQTYHLFYYELKLDTFTSDEENQLFNFFNLTTFYTGMCIPTPCSDWVKYFFTPEINTKFYEDYLPSNSSPISNITLLDKKLPPCPNGLFWLLALFSLIFLGQVIGFVVHFILSSIQKINLNESLDALKEASIDESEEMEIFAKYASSKGKLLRKTCKDMIISLTSKVNIVNSYSLLITKTSKYYNQLNLELISFYQTIVLFFLVFNQTLSTMHKLPSRGFVSYDFYKTLYFSIVVMSSYAIDCWVALDGMVMIYKLMSYLKTYVFNQNKLISFKDFLKFYSKAFGKVITGVMLFFLVHFYSNYIVKAHSLSKGLFDFYIETWFEKDVLNKAYYYLIPFYYYYNTQMYLTTTLQYIAILINEFYVFSLFLILFYLSLRMKSKLFDISLLALVCGNIIFAYFSLKDRKDQITFSFITQSSFFRQYPHLMFNNYFIGVIGGMILFYFKDVISMKPISINTQSFLPYHYCYHINARLFSIKPIIRTILSLVIIVIGILISMIYPLVSFSRSLNMKITTILWFVFNYDRVVFTILFITLIILTEMNLKKDGIFRNLIKWKMFRVSSRISFCFLCSFDIWIIAFFCLFDFQLKLSYENLWLISLGFFLLCGAYTSVFTIAVELPLRMLLKDWSYNERGVFEPFALPLEN